jgi:hypothetical protein
MEKNHTLTFLAGFSGFFLTVLGDADGVGEGSGLVGLECSSSSLKEKQNKVVSELHLRVHFNDATLHCSALSKLKL